jgi:hypothetical protein
MIKKVNTNMVKNPNIKRDEVLFQIGIWGYYIRFLYLFAPALPQKLTIWVENRDFFWFFFAFFKIDLQNY